MPNPSHPIHFPLNPIAWIAGLLVATLAVPAAAGSFYRYETDDGGIAFTDDPKRIPARYRDDAETIARQGFDGFDRYTHVEAEREAGHEGRTAARLGHLRDLNARLVTPGAVGAPQPGAGPGGLTLRTSRGGPSVESVVGRAGGDEPVIVEKVRTRPDGSPVTRHVTIVRQGDRILSVIAPEKNHSTTRSLDERELFDATGEHFE